MTSGKFRTLTDLPSVIPVFPLSGVLMLPHSQLPLNIFEPRYLNMFDDAMASHRVIGMIQTVPGSDRARPDLVKVGCLGQINSFSETSDGRYEIIRTADVRRSSHHSPVKALVCSFLQVWRDTRALRQRRSM